MQAHAVDQYFIDCIYAGDGNKIIQVKDGDVLPLNTNLYCIFWSDDPNATKIDIDFIDPTGVNNGCHDCPYKTSDDFVFSIITSSLMPGGYTTHAVFKGPTGDKITEEKLNMSVSFEVVPESPIGMIALVGSSLAVLGVFAVRRIKIT